MLVALPFFSFSQQKSRVYDETRLFWPEISGSDATSLAVVVSGFGHFDGVAQSYCAAQTSRCAVT